MPEVINCCFFLCLSFIPPSCCVNPWVIALLLVSLTEVLRGCLSGAAKGVSLQHAVLFGCSLPVLFESMLFIWKLLLWLERTFPGADLSCDHVVIIFIITFIFITCTYPEAHSPCACIGADSSRDESCQCFQLQWMRASSVLKLCLYRGASKVPSFLLDFSVCFYSVAST